MEKYFYSYEDFSKDTEAFSDRIYPPDYIVAVGSGGLVPAIYLKKYLGDNIRILNLGIKTYEGSTQTNSVSVYQNIDALQLVSKKVLIVDDICDSGKTLSIVTEMLTPLEGVNLETAALFWNELSPYKPTYYIHKSEGRWIVFPWEKE